jgi:hypothetical protein
MERLKWSLIGWFFLTDSEALDGSDIKTLNELFSATSGNIFSPDIDFSMPLQDIISNVTK